jgi:hypothetical protein
MPAVLLASFCQPVRPGLGGNGIAVADQGMILFFGQDIDGIEEIKPVGMTGQIIIKVFFEFWK